MNLQRKTAQPGFQTLLRSYSQPRIADVVNGILLCGTNDGQSLKVVPEESFASPEDTAYYCENIVSSAEVKFYGATFSSK